ncbi:alpha/beta fold hydrolase [Saccharibacillus alkalitolerans]|uniref:Alpha/beta fold hydrolase n=1 Tax=Saccharibacillus alkalitolerans TaxID=2705290 RepID=A0ABX0EYM3_9BACL|nr:alpha/beta fold hydrolase [Saccharibacillus alkalitolerans]NGZ73726.1 alpha/beta fold hydrolase [Saccharibacillus alkalitolerans]
MLTGTRSPIRPFESGRRRGRRGGGQPRRKSRLFFLIVAVVLLIVLAAAAVYAGTPYKPSAEAEAAMKSDDAAAVSQTDDWIEFRPAAAEGAKQPGVIFYPGGRVKPEAYAPLARALAENGHHVFVVKMPFNFAFLGQNEAEKVRDKYPDETFAIGGHSLGGPFAARYASEHPGDIAGIFFLASYAEGKGDLSGTQMPALSITASEDNVLNRESYEAGRAYLPGSAQYEVIEGGNHAQFGSYGEQKGDGKASISETEQRERTTDLLEAWLNAIPATAE